ncbi:hypothetical protein [Gordonia amarae]|uniref:hypothetical protein n=1 Tax=Gordonia amarae TaxID=36821 RepID=UPI0002E7B872
MLAAAVMADDDRAIAVATLGAGEPVLAISDAVLGTSKALPPHLVELVQEEVDDGMFEMVPGWTDAMNTALDRMRQAG